MNLITQYGLHRLVLVLGYIWVRVGFILQNLAPHIGIYVAGVS